MLIDDIKILLLIKSFFFSVFWISDFSLSLQYIIKIHQNNQIKGFSLILLITLLCRVVPQRYGHPDQTCIFSDPRCLKKLSTLFGKCT